MPSGPIHKQNGVSAGRDGDGDLLEVERHGLGVAGWEDETGRPAERGTDGAENIGGGGSLILQGKRSRAAFREAGRARKHYARPRTVQVTRPQSRRERIFANY